MKFIKYVAFIMALILMLTTIGCSKVDNDYGVSSEALADTESVQSLQSLPEVYSLDNKMSKYFDISLFDEENYANIYLGRNFKIKANYSGSEFVFPITMEDIAKNGWHLVSGSDYDENSLVYAKETVDLYFTNEEGAKIWALFYNSSNSSVRLSKCNIAKFRIENNYFKTKEKYHKFNVNGITNTTVITDIIQILGTPSHFYQMTEDTYYFDYFLQKRDRRNKIRVYINLTDDSVTAVEFSCYK